MTDVYKIGVSVVLGNLMSGELLKIIGQLGIADKAALGFAAKVGLISGAVTVMGVAIAGSVKEAAKFQMEATRFATLGFGDAVNGQAQAFAKGMNTIGTSSTENMALLSDAMAVFKDLGHAEMAAPIMSKMKFANETLYGAESGGANERKFMDMLKVVEFRGGLQNDQEFHTQANFVQQVINGSRNRVDATQLLMALKTGGVALSRLNNDSFYLGSEPLIQEFGGSRYGTANMSAYQNLVMMRTTQQSLTEQMRLGLLDTSKIEMNSFTGKVKRAKPGAFKGSSVFEQEGDMALLEKILLPAFAKAGITSDEAIIREIGTIFTNRTASGLFARLYQQRASIKKQQDANRGAMNIDQTANAAAGTIDGQIKELDAQWKTLEQRIGETILPTLIKVLTSINDGFHWLETSPTVANLFGANSQQRSASASIQFWKGMFGSSGGGVDGTPPATRSQAITVDHSTILDGRVLANSVTQYQVNGMATAPNSGTSFDGRLAPLSVN